jgi:hypothetical protein
MRAPPGDRAPVGGAELPLDRLEQDHQHRLP